MYVPIFWHADLHADMLTTFSILAFIANQFKTFEMFVYVHSLLFTVSTFLV